MQSVRPCHGPPALLPGFPADGDRAPGWRKCSSVVGCEGDGDVRVWKMTHAKVLLECRGPTGRDPTRRHSPTLRAAPHLASTPDSRTMRALIMTAPPNRPNRTVPSHAVTWAKWSWRTGLVAGEFQVSWAGL